LRFAYEAENVETIDGVLQPQARNQVMAGEFYPALGENVRIETIARFHRRWYTEGNREWLICAAGGELYYRQVGDNRGWAVIQRPQSSGTFANNVWSWVTYEKNILDENEEAETIDVLLISNADDGMYMVEPPDRQSIWEDYREYTWGEEYDGDTHLYTWDDVYSKKWHVNPVDTSPGEDGEGNPLPGYKFGVIERFQERIWGGAIAGEPDVLAYSRPYIADNWKLAGADEDDPEGMPPEDGGGEVRQPSWDGDSFTALKRFGDQLLAFKGTKVWRVMGVSPGEYTFTEQYGGGTIYPNTIADDVERVLLVEKDGLSVYDGMTVQPYGRGFIEKFWRTVNRDAMDQMCAAMFKHRYYLAVPTGNSEVNNALIVYNTDDGSFLLYTDTYIESLMAGGDVLYATTSSLPGKVLFINYNSWETGSSSGLPSLWRTPWMDFNYKTIAKGGYEIYFNPEVKGAPVTFRFSIETEKKTKTKEITIQPTTFKEKQKRIRFGGTSRRFRLVIETLRVPTNTVWRLTGGIHMVVETDPD